MTTMTRTPLTWDQSDPTAWLDNPLAETTRHGAAMTAQFPADMRMAYMPQSGVVCMVPLHEGVNLGGWQPTIPLCGTPHYSMVELDAIPGAYSVCRLCTTAYNAGATTGVKPDPFPPGSTVEFPVQIGDSHGVQRGTVTPSRFNRYRVVQIREGLSVEVHIGNLTLLIPEGTT